MRRVFSVFTVLVIGMTLLVCLQRTHIALAELDLQKAMQDESVEVRLARAHVALAKLDLQRAMESNKRLPGVYPSEFIEKLKLHVVIDEANLEQCLKGKDADAHQVCIRNAEASVKLAEADLKRATGIHRRRPTAGNVLNVKRAEVAAKIAKLNLESTQDLEASESVATHLQWQIDQLRHQVLELQMRHQDITARETSSN